MRVGYGRLHGRGVPAAVAGLCLLIALALTFRPVVQGDGVGYYAYLHAILVRHSLDLGPEYAAATAARVNTDPAELEARTATGLPADYFPIGPALLSGPATIAALVLGGDGQPEYSPLLVGAFAITSLLLGLLALLLCWRLTGSPVAVAATALCTPLIFYLLFEPSYSHMFSAFAVAAFVWVWWRDRDDRSALGWLALGALAGLMAITRWQDATLAAVALLTPPARGARWRLAPMAAGTALVLAPQLAAGHVIFGTWWPQRPPGQGLNPLALHQFQVLVSSWHGLFVWNPVTLLAAGGALVVRDRRLRMACLYALIAETLIDGSTPDWTGGAAFGARRFLDLAPFWAIGLAALANRLPAAAAWAGTVVLAAWNALLMANVEYVTGGSADPGYLGLLAGQVHALRYLPRLAAQGVAGRDLILWPFTSETPAPLAGLAWLTAEAACVAICVAVVIAALRRTPGERSRPLALRPLPVPVDAPGRGRGQ